VRQASGAAPGHVGKPSALDECGTAWRSFKKRQVARVDSPPFWRGRTDCSQPTEPVACATGAKADDPTSVAGYPANSLCGNDIAHFRPRLVRFSSTEWIIDNGFDEEGP